MAGIFVLLVAVGFSLLMILLKMEAWNRSELRRRTGINQPLWPWIASTVIIVGGVLGLAVSLDSGQPLRFVGTGVFLIITLALFAWRLRQEGRR